MLKRTLSVLLATLTVPFAYGVLIGALEVGDEIEDWLRSTYVSHAQDYVIDNAAGAVVRAEINTNLADAATNSAGTTDPCTLISFGCGGKMWLDTNPATPVFRFRNVADTGWADLFTIDGTTVTWQGNVSAASATIGALTADLSLSNNDLTNVKSVQFGGSTFQDYIDHLTGFGTRFFENGSEVARLGFNGLRLYNGGTEKLAINGDTSQMRYNVPTEHLFQVGGTTRLTVRNATAQVLVNGSLQADRLAAFGNVEVYSNGHMLPLGSTTQDLGNAIDRWRNVYLRNSPNVLSDARLKSDIGPVLPAECRAAARFEAKRYRKDGTIHFGYIAQEVEAAFVAESLDPDDYALVQTGEDGFRAVVYAEVEALKTACN